MYVQDQKMYSYYSIPYFVEELLFFCSNMPSLHMLCHTFFNESLWVVVAQQNSCLKACGSTLIVKFKLKCSFRFSWKFNVMKVFECLLWKYKHIHEIKHAPTGVEFGKLSSSHTYFKDVLNKIMQIIFLKRC